LEEALNLSSDRILNDDDDKNNTKRDKTSNDVAYNFLLRFVKLSGYSEECVGFSTKEQERMQNMSSRDEQQLDIGRLIRSTVQI
jgi:hypothetical protein